MLENVFCELTVKLNFEHQNQSVQLEVCTLFNDNFHQTFLFYPVQENGSNMRSQQPWPPNSNQFKFSLVQEAICSKYEKKPPKVFRTKCIYKNGMDRLSLMWRQKNKGNSVAPLLITYSATVRVMWSVNRINQGWKISQIKQLIASLMSLFVCRRNSHSAIQQAPIILIIFQITIPNLSSISFHN